MTVEEAVEIVLGAQPWEKCEVCKGRGFIHRDDAKPCWRCDGKAFYVQPKIRKAYRIMGAELPARPLNGREKIAAAGAEFIKSRLNETTRNTRAFLDLLLERKP